MTHDELVARAERWLRRSAGCSVVFNDRIQSAASERPDAIGWRYGVSILVECKASRGDFLTDQRKICRRHPAQGMGAHRLFLCPPGMIQPHELPERWGLLYAHPKKVERVICPKGNTNWGQTLAFPERNGDAEILLLLSALRRMEIRGLLNLIYEPLPSHLPPEL